MPFPGNAVIPQVPSCPERYSSVHPDRVKKYPHRERNMLSGPSPDNGSHPWRHELDHDAESVFWLIYYWALCVQPEGYPKQDIPDDLWGGVTGSVGSRIRILGAIAGRFYPDHGTHSLYAPLWPLIEQLAAILLVDGYWLDNSEPRRNLGYITEAFQRLILDFVLKHHDQTFMSCKVTKNLRDLEKKTPNGTHVCYEQPSQGSW